MTLPPEPLFQGPIFQAPIFQAKTPACAEAMAAAHQAAFPPAEAWSAAVFRSQLDLPGSIGLIHPAGGLILVRLAADEAEVLTLAVAPQARRKGVASILLREAMERLTAGGARILFLEVSEQNTAALALYRNAGFIEVGRRRRYYPDGSDARVLRRSLEP